MSSKAIIKALADLAVQYPRFEMTDDIYRVYTKQLSDLPVPAVLAAIERCGKTLTFFPAVAEIRKEVGAHAADTGEIAESAWIEVMSEARRVGYNRPPVFMNGEFLPVPTTQFSSEMIRRAVESVGWARICTGLIDEVRKDFIFTYRNLKDQAIGQVQRGEFTDVADTAPAIGETVRALPDRRAS